MKQINIPNETTELDGYVLTTGSIVYKHPTTYLLDLLDLVRLHLVGSPRHLRSDTHLGTLHNLDYCCIQDGREDQQYSFFNGRICFIKGNSTKIGHKT